ncbi:hypothetical protein [Aromatoleum sp.]|uniref:hypothetical protein n=1 Tax=Aromatoleum sp. TaxID=2307007 RepID=UPI002FCC530A
MTMLLTETELRRENRIFEGTGGRSEENRGSGFEPAFLDNETHRIYRSRFADGRPAPCHLLDGLPDEVVVARDGRGRVAATKGSLVSGFLRCGEFYTRDEAVAALAT